MFEIKSVTKKYNEEFALNNVSLNIGKGLNFIVGASGSGKTTLLKIMSGMEQDFEGEVTYNNKNIKELSIKERSYFYNNIFGFIWQDFNLIEEATVLENVMLPQYLKSSQSYKEAESILRNLKILDLMQKKVMFLSGGQKQRVAIARELMKNPQVIIADEPTSALDQKTSKATLDILRDISKTRAVIVVTHDTSLITPKDNVFVLDKGEIIQVPEDSSNDMKNIQEDMTHKITLKNSFVIAKSIIKNKISRVIIAVLTLIIASTLLLITLQGTVSNSTQDEFDKLIETYGDSLLDIGLYSNFIDASGTDGNKNNRPGGEVNQDISFLYDKYKNDERVAFISYLQAFDNIKVNLDGKDYSVKFSGNSPTINKLVAGNMPMGDGKEVVIPESLVKKWGMSPNQVIGKEIKFDGSINNWVGGKPIPKYTSSTVKIVGVMDTTVKYDYAGEVREYTVDDAFIFSKTALSEMMTQAGKNISSSNFLLRAKTPKDMITLKDEINEQGIVPIGRFELVEDMVRLNNQTTEQSGAATIIISILAIVMVIAIFLITGFMRSKEYAIYKISGFKNVNISLLSLAETVFYAIGAILLFVILSPLLNLITTNMFSISILNVNMILTGILVIILLSMVSYITTSITYIKTNIATALKTGEKQ